MDSITPAQTIAKKVCSRCKLTKEANLIEFYIDKKTKSGWSSWCRICNRIHAKKGRKGILKPSPLQGELLRAPLIPDSAGIYQFQHVASGKVYVGSAQNLRKRMSVHLWALQRKIHHSAPLQHAWTKYGPPTFEFSIIEHVTDLDLLIEREQFWIDNLKAANRETGFNVLAVAGTVRGHRYTEEQKIKSWGHMGELMRSRPEWPARIGQSQKGRKRPDLLLRIERLQKSSHTPEVNAKRGRANRQKFTLTSPENVLYNIDSVAELDAFCKRRELTPRKFRDLADENISKYKGWQAVRRSKKRVVVQKTNPRWRVFAPDGTWMDVYSLATYAKAIGANASDLIRTARGKRTHSKGYSCIDLRVIPVA